MTVDVPDVIDTTMFTGTLKYYRAPLARGLVYTDGAKHVADKGEAYWLIDAIFALQHDAFVKRQPFQVWILAVAEDRSGLLICEDGNHNVVIERAVEFTTFPQGQQRLWFENRCLMVPTER